MNRTTLGWRMADMTAICGHIKTVMTVQRIQVTASNMLASDPGQERGLTS